MKQVPVVIGSSLGAIASGLVATAATFCCVGPAVIAILGTSGVVAAARLAPYRPYFILGSVMLLGSWLLAGLSSQRRMRRKNMHYDEREDHARPSVDRGSDHRSGHLTSQLRRGSVMKRGRSQVKCNQSCGTGSHADSSAPYHVK